MADPRIHQLKAVNRLLKASQARDSLLEFMKLTMPDTEDVEDATRTRFETTPQARLLCEMVERVEKQSLLRSATSIMPQGGKSQILSRGAPAWIAGRNPYRHMILGSYNQDFANDFGHDVRTIMESSVYKQIFPKFELAAGGAAKDHLVTAQGGKLSFVGVGGSGSGKPADLFVVDDPYRNSEDAESTSYREKVWKWFQSVVFARCHDKTAILVVHTRWSEDDLIGRMCDPNHPERNGLYKGIAKRWTYINLPAVVEDPKLADALGLRLEEPTIEVVRRLNPKPPKMPQVEWEQKTADDQAAIVEQFGSRPMSALWPGRKSLPLMAEAKQGDPKVFGALYMGRPSPDDGDYFQKDYLVEYDRDDLPKNLRKYGASDHAVSKKQRADSSVIGCIGVDEQDHLWVMPDIAWRRMQTDKTVEELLMQFKIHKPMLWWLEDELISKSFGPFLIKRMREEKIYTTLDPLVPTQDIETRARSIQGRAQMRMVHFPKFAPWWQAAKTQLLMFPSATHDDFVSWLALIGLGLTKNVRARATKAKTDDNVLPGSMQWLLRASDKKLRRKIADDAKAGW